MARVRLGRARALGAALLIAVGALPLVGPANAASTLAVDAPGWQVIVPPGPDGVYADRAFSGHDITGDGRDDLVIQYTPDYYLKRNPPFFASNITWDVFGGGADGLASSAMSRSSTNLSFGYVDTGVTFPRKAFDFNGDGRADSSFSGSNYYYDFNQSWIEATAQFYFGSPAGAPAQPSCTANRAADPNASLSFSWFPGGDFDGDGASDMVLMETSYGVSVPPQGNNGSGGSQPGTALQVLRGGAGCAFDSRWSEALWIPAAYGGIPSVIGWGDFNGDGKDDIVVDEPSYPSATNVDHHLTIFGGSASAPLNGSVTKLSIGASRSTKFAPGIDLNHDGYGDLALLLGYQAGFSGEYFSILLYPGSASGLWADPAPTQTLAGTGYASATASFGDFDGDGNPDLALIQANTSYNSAVATLSIYFGDAGTFPAARDWNQTIFVNDTTATNTTWAIYGTMSVTMDASGDFDGDGRSDLAVLAGSRGYGPFPLSGATVNAPAGGVALVYYGYQVLRDVSGVEAVGFDRGVAYPTFEYGWNVKQRATNRTYFDTLDIETEVGAVSYNVTADAFSFVAGGIYAGGQYIMLDGNSSAFWDEAAKTWDVRFRFEFNWSFPREDIQTYRLVPRHGGLAATIGRGPAGEFRLEKDLAFVGDLAARDVTRGTALSRGGWVAGNDSLEFSGLRVVFEGTMDKWVPPSFFTWSASDDDLTLWSQAGGPLSLQATADDRSDPGDNLTFGLSGLPDPDVSAPTTSFPFRVDADAPTLGGALPSNESWIASRTVTIGIVALDPLSGVDLSTLEYTLSTTGPASFGPWFSPTLDASDPLAVRARADAFFDNGEANFFKFRVKDLVGNGYTESAPYQVRVDTLHVVFHDPSPDPALWQRDTTITVGITISDAQLSGVDGASVSYRTSTDDIFGYGPWHPVSGLSSSVDISILRQDLFAEGDANYVQWRAQDIAGNGLTVSDHYRNRADATPLTFGAFAPAPSQRRTSEHVTASINFTEGRARTVAQSGVNASSLEFRFRPAGGNFSNWTNAGLTVYDADGWNWTARADLTLAPGPGNEVEFRGRDLAGNGPAVTATFALHLNRAPTASIVLAPASGRVFLNDSVLLTSLMEDADGDELNSSWTGPTGGGGLNETSVLNLTLPLGNHTFTLTVTDPFGAEATATVSVEVVLRPPPPPPPPPPPAVVVESTNLSLLFAGLMILAAAGGGAYLIYVRRRRPPSV